MGRTLPRGAYRLLAVMLVAATILVYRDVWTARELSVSVLPAGKGHAVLVRGPTGTTLLINAGADASILRALGNTLSPWQRSLDALLLTNISAKTSGGAPLVLARYRIPLIVRPAVRGTRTYEDIFAAAAATSRTLMGERGMRLDLGGGAYADVLWPPRAEEALTGQGGSAAFILGYGSASFLIYDDLPAHIASRLPEADVVIASTTAQGRWASDGRAITKTPSP